MGELVCSKENLLGKSWKISFTRDLFQVLSAECVSASLHADMLTDLLQALCLNWNPLPGLKEIRNTQPRQNQCPEDIPFVLTFISAARYAQAAVAGIMEILSSQRHFVSKNIFILHPSLAGGEFFCLVKSHSSFGTKCSPVSRVSLWFYWRTVLQTKTMLYFTTLFELPLCHFPEEHDRPTTKLCFKILCPI